MPKGFYFTAVVLFLFSFFFLSSFFFSTPNFWGHWTDLNETWTHIHLWLLFEKFGPNSPGIYPHELRANNVFGDRLWTLTEHIFAKEHDINNRKETCQPTATFLHAPKFGKLWSKNGKNVWRVFAHSPKFSHWETASLTACTLYNRQQANFGTCLQSRITECRAGSRLALPCI